MTFHPSAGASSSRRLEGSTDVLHPTFKGGFIKKIPSFPGSDSEDLHN